MFQEILKKLKSDKKQLQIELYHNFQVESSSPNFEIILSKENSLFLMEISDYISIIDYVDKMKQIDNFGIEDMVSNAVLWNSGKQKVNQGIYYVVKLGNKLYNILVNDICIKIDERTDKKGIIEEKILSLDVKSNDYSYTLHNHDETGNTFYTSFFNKKGVSFGKLDLSVQEFLGNFNELIYNLENIDYINKIVDLESIRKCIVDDLDKKSFQKKL